MKRILICLLIVCQYFIAFGQIDYKLTDTKRNINFANSLKNEEKRSKLNFYLNEDWMGGVIFRHDSTTINGCTFMYNIYTDQVELRTLVNPSTVEYLSIGSKKFVYTEYLDADSILFEGYFELVINGDCRLLLRREMKATQGEDDVRIYGSSSSTKISEMLYIEKKGEPAIEVVKTKSFFMELFSDKEPMRKYFKDKFSLYKSGKKIREVVEHYNNI